MNLRNLFIPIAGVVLLVFGYRTYGWQGVALVGGAAVMVLLLQFNRAMQVLRRAADRPVGSVDSAVMLNAKLKPRVNLMHVVAMTRAIGELRTPKDAQPEVFRWTDGTGSRVDATFVNGRLTEWSLFRPQTADEVAAAEAPASDALRPPV